MLAIQTILHPTDFSDASTDAFRLACAFARDYRARLVILHVYPAPNALEWPDDSREVDYEAALLPQLHKMKPSDPQIQVTYHLLEGHAAEAILDVADREKCDLIVMGTHGRSGFRRAVLGSVAETVARLARCPVATVRSLTKIVPETNISEPG